MVHERGLDTWTFQCWLWLRSHFPVYAVQSPVIVSPRVLLSRPQWLLLSPASWGYFLKLLRTLTWFALLWIDHTLSCFYLLAVILPSFSAVTVYLENWENSSVGKVLAVSLVTRVHFPEPMWRLKERTDSTELSSDPHTYNVASVLPPHQNTLVVNKHLKTSKEKYTNFLIARNSISPQAGWRLKI